MNFSKTLYPIKKNYFYVKTQHFRNSSSKLCFDMIEIRKNKTKHKTLHLLCNLNYENNIQNKTKYDKLFHEKKIKIILYVSLDSKSFLQVD